MRSRIAFVLGALVLGFMSPIVPRLFTAMFDAEQAEQFWRWTGRGLSLKALPTWLFVLSPFLILAAMTSWTHRESVAPAYRIARCRSYWITALLVFGIGLLLCSPVKGQGMDFYLGEELFPLVAFPTMAVAYPVIYRICRSRCSAK